MRRFGEGSSDVTLSQKLAQEMLYEEENGVQESLPEFLKDFQAQGIWTIEDTPGLDEITLSRQFGNENIRLIFSIADISPAEDEFNPEEGEESGNDSVSYPVRASMSITKSNGGGALSIDLMAQDGHFILDNISFYDDAKIGTELSAEADWKRRGLYIGPQFDTLEPALQDEFETFLQERGVNEAIALFIPQYAEYKEQKEYVKWLNKVKGFVDL